jgi:disease resistance protein RPM1
MASEVGAQVLAAAVPSLGNLLKYELGLDKTVEDELASFEGELITMHAFLGDVSGMPTDQLESQVKLVARQVRELSHAIEIRLHSFVVRIELARRKGALLPALSKQIINLELASYIQDTRIKVKEVDKRYGPYPGKSSLESTSTRGVDHRILAGYTRESNPVGIDGAIDEITKKLSKDNHVSIVGMGGMGKTTLAQAVYDKMKEEGEFDCSAFIPIGQRADMKKVLMDIFDELHVEIHGHAADQDQLTIQLHKFLVDKRYALLFPYMLTSHVS